jgi:hypothetical protein
LRSQFADIKILVGCWALNDDLERIKERLSEAGADYVATQLSETCKQLFPLVQFKASQPKAPRVVQPA